MSKDTLSLLPLPLGALSLAVSHLTGGHQTYGRVLLLIIISVSLTLFILILMIFRRALGILFLKMFVDSLFNGIKGTTELAWEDFEDSVKKRLTKLRESVDKDRVRAGLAIEIIGAALQRRPEDRFV